MLNLSSRGVEITLEARCHRRFCAETVFESRFGSGLGGQAAGVFDRFSCGTLAADRPRTSLTAPDGDLKQKGRNPPTFRGLRPWEMAGSTGLEPAASGLTGQCANQAAPRPPLEISDFAHMGQARPDQPMPTPSPGDHWPSWPGSSVNDMLGSGKEDGLPWRTGC